MPICQPSAGNSPSKQNTSPVATHFNNKRRSWNMRKIFAMPIRNLVTKCIRPVAALRSHNRYCTNTGHAADIRPAYVILWPTLCTVVLAMHADRQVVLCRNTPEKSKLETTCFMRMCATQELQISSQTSEILDLTHWFALG